MILTGIDIIEISRIKKSIQNPRFIDKIFSEEEQKELLLKKNKRNKIESIAARFCAKEAFAKAIGTGIFNINLREVEILHESTGKSYIKLTGNLYKKYKNSEISVSLSHEKTYACAIVICTETCE